MSWTATCGDDPEAKESIAFLEWLLEDHFTFLGMCDYEVVGEKEERALHLSRRI